MKFVIDNAPVSISSLPGMARDMLSVLDKLPDGKLISTRKFAESVGCKATSLHQHTGIAVFNDYKVRYNQGNLWGNKKTITAFRKEYGL